jgi:hypothetical protein
MNADGIASHSPRSGIQGVEVINRIFGKYDSIDYVVMMAYFWPDYNCEGRDVVKAPVKTGMV